MTFSCPIWMRRTRPVGIRRWAKVDIDFGDGDDNNDNGHIKNHHRNRFSVVRQSAAISNAST